MVTTDQRSTPKDPSNTQVPSCLALQRPSRATNQPTLLYHAGARLPFMRDCRCLPIMRIYERHFVPPPLYLDSLFPKVQGPTPPSQRVGWTFRKVQGPTPPSRRVGWTFGKVQIPTPPKGSKRPSKSAAGRRKMCVFKGFTGDFYVVSTHLRVDLTF